MASVVQQLFFLVLLSAVAKCWWWSNSKDEGTGWDELSVTWGKFSSLPKEVSDAQKNGWKKISSCNSNSHFRGNRYILGNDKTVMLLFDIQGKIAGIQFGILKILATNPGYKKVHWISDGNALVITAYFIHPSAICNGQRKSSSYIGENLYIQVGSTPNDWKLIPFKESELSSTKWRKGKCFYTMGQHYWYDISKNMQCKDFLPVFLLYNGGKLNGFGWATQGDVRSSRVEHPTPSVFPYIFQPETQPQCFSEAGTLTTQHVYLQRRPYLNFC